MNIHNESTLKSFAREFPDAKKALDLWYFEASNKTWKTPNEVKRDYASASIVSSTRVVFNIKGNDYRLIADFNYAKGWIFVKFLGTHKEYDKVDAKTVDLYKKH
jgi:mRNA interferase HigB